MLRSDGFRSVFGPGIVKVSVKHAAFGIICELYIQQLDHLEVVFVLGYIMLYEGALQVRRTYIDSSADLENLCYAAAIDFANF